MRPVIFIIAFISGILCSCTDEPVKTHLHGKHGVSFLDKTTGTGEDFEVSIGVLSALNDAPGQMALISRAHKPYFLMHDSLICRGLLKTGPGDLPPGLDFFSYTETGDSLYGISVIPCGSITYLR